MMAYTCIKYKFQDLMTDAVLHNIWPLKLMAAQMYLQVNEHGFRHFPADTGASGRAGVYLRKREYEGMSTHMCLGERICSWECMRTCA